MAYVIYTSGSTGRPKGTMNTHRGIVNRLLWMQKEYGLTADDRVLQKTPFSFDVSVWEFFWPLLTGACLVVARPGGHQDPSYLVETIATEGITTLHFVPSMLQVFLEAPGVERCASLRRVICSGEALPLDLTRRFREKLSAGLHNLYGPTEAAVDVTYWACDGEAGRSSVPIGRPVANTQIWILDRNLVPVPVGVPGELHIGGVQLARGYRARPELTAEKFIPDPFAGDGKRLYKTGDLARWLPDGAVDFLGRIDHQVKVRGLRIELGEIEAALAAHPAVREAVVLARAGGAAVGDVNLVAYVTVHEGQEAPDLPALRSLLARHLPEHMLPAALVVLPAMPLSPNGKADRKALAQIAPDMGVAVPAERVAPRNGLERFLERLWMDVLAVLEEDGFGVHDSFFQLGGNSITGAIFINRLQQELGEIVHVVTIFDHPTIAGLAAFVATEYPRAVERLFGAEALVGVSGFDGIKSRRVNEDLIAELSRLVHQLGPIPDEIAAEPKNPSAVFVLSPPRSGSTLLRVMLAGHPSLFAPPELELLGFDTMAERRDAFPGRDAFRLEGLLRAVMEARRCGPEEARAIVDGFEREGVSTRAIYGRLQEWIGGRTLVDKTPTYAWDAQALRRAEAGFEGARYVHLVRHPLGMVKSFEEARIDQIFFHEDHPWSRREVAEALWALAQKNTLEFLAGIPAERQHTVLFEDLLRDPERVLRGLCAFLGIDYHPDMAEPYRPGSARMTDGLHAESRMLGDVKFHQHGRVEAGVAESWRQEYREESLGEPARALAVRLGYALPQTSPAGSWIPIPHVETAPGEEMALSFAQERLWFLEQLDPGQPTYNMVAAVHLKGVLDTAALQESLSEVVRRHEGLRVTFAARSGKPVQVVQPAVPLEMPRVDLSGAADPTDPEKEARRLVLREHSRNFDLGAGPLFRATLLVLGPEEHALLLSMHHIVSDGWSLGVLVREVAALYMAFSQRRPSPLAPLPIQYADFARWQRDWLRGALLDEQLGYWKERLADAAPLPLPVDRQPVSEKDFHVDGVPVTVPAELTARLKDLSRRHGTTLFMTLLAAFQALLARHTGQGDVVVATPVAGRTRAETEGLIGFFVNTLVLRVDAGSPHPRPSPSSPHAPAGRGETRRSQEEEGADRSLLFSPLPGTGRGELGEGPGVRASGGLTFGELLTRVRQVTLGAYDHQELPFAMLVEALRPERHLGSYPLAEVLFALQNHPMPALELPGMSLRPLAATDEDNEEDAETQANFSLTLRFWESADGSLSGGFAFNTALFDRSTLERWQGHVMSTLEAVAADSELRLAELPFLSESERAQAVQRTAEAKPVEKAPAAPVAEAVAQQRNDLLSKREALSAAKRELLERRLRGKAAGGAAPAAPRPASPTVLVKLQAGSAAKKPFFCVHAIGGAVFSYAELARCLGPDRPFYGLQARGIEGGSSDLRDIPAMAAAYAAAIRSVQPEGPYLLGGWSFGGVVAFEMARQLQAGGSAVSRLVLLDSHVPVEGADLDDRDDADLLRFALKDHAEIAAGAKPEQVQRLLGVYKANLLALASYRPQPYDGRITLFRPEGAPPEVRAREANGWGPLSTVPIDVRWVEGTHYTMLQQPEVRALAERLEDCLETP